MSKMLCETCGSNRVVRDAWAEWDPEKNEWSLGNVFDYAFCMDCEESTKLYEAEEE